MMSEECPNCRQLTNTSFSRLIKDSCGHTKCRMCLLYEEQGCKACHNEHHAQTNENFDYLQMSNNTYTNIENFTREEEIVLPLELVINKSSKLLEDSHEFIPAKSINNIESHKKDEIFINNEKTLCKLSTGSTNYTGDPNRLYIAKIESSNLVSNLHLNHQSNVTDHSQNTYIDLTSTTKSVTELESKAECTDKEKLGRNKHLKLAERSHISVVPGFPERYKCNLCGKVFKNKKGICYHDACITGIKPYQCNFCDRSFVKRSHFEYHERIHSGYKPYKCKLCDKAFPQQNKLNRHMFSHNKEKQFVCTKCDKRYSKKEDLKNHLNVHNRTTVYTCKSCGKSFYVLTNLKRHMRTHSDERPHTCDQCNKSFKDKSLLIRHKRTHGKDRPFSCAHCNRVFLSKSELRRHLTVHSDDKPFSCEFCQTVFRRKDNLNRHIRHHHTEDSLFETCKVQSIEENTNKKTLKTKEISNVKQKQKAKRTQRVASSVAPKSPNKISGSYVNSREQINSRLDSMGNITPVIRTTTELSNAVPVINGPISIRKLEDKLENRKKTFTYIEPIPLAETRVINRRIEEKLYPQKASSHNYYFCNCENHNDKQNYTITPQAAGMNVCTKNNYFVDNSSSERTTRENNFICEEANTGNLKFQKNRVVQNQDCEKPSVEHTRTSLYEQKDFVAEVININHANSKEDNTFVHSLKQEQTNCVPTIKKTYSTST